MKLLTASEVGDRLSVPATWVYRAARDGTLPHVTLGRYVRFDPDHIDQWIREQASTTARAS